MKDCVLGVILWNVVFAVYYLEFGSLFKWVLLKAKQIKDAAQSLQGKKTRLFKNTTNNNCRQKNSVLHCTLTRCYVTRNTNAPKSELPIRIYLLFNIQLCGETNKMLFCFVTPVATSLEKTKKELII